MAPAIPADRAIEKAIEKKLSKLTLEEKVGQMTEVAIDILLPSNYGADALANILAGDANPSAKLPCI